MAFCVVDGSAPIWLAICCVPPAPSCCSTRSRILMKTCWKGGTLRKRSQAIGRIAPGATPRCYLQYIPRRCSPGAQVRGLPNSGRPVDVRTFIHPRSRKNNVSVRSSSRDSVTLRPPAHSGCAPMYAPSAIITTPIVNTIVFRGPIGRATKVGVEGNDPRSAQSTLAIKSARRFRANRQRSVACYAIPCVVRGRGSAAASGPATAGRAGGAGRDTRASCA